MRPSRRGLLHGIGAIAGVLASRHAVAASTERKFLFVFCRGGWDTGRLFTPMAHIPGASIEADATVSEVGGIRFVDSPERPAVRSWIEQYAGQTVFINGMEVRSVAHERCRRLLLCGDGEDDWPALLASSSSEAKRMPELVLSGPSFTGRYADQVVRVGDDGQLGRLISGTVFTDSTLPLSPLYAGVESKVDAYLRSRLTEQSQAGSLAAFAANYGTALDNLSGVQTVQGLSFDPQAAGCARDVMADVRSALLCFSLGLSRTAMVQYDGWCDQTWDTHTNLDLQSTNFEELFTYLDGVMSEIADRGLADSVTVVVLSEMGRHPMVNNRGGKDHWTMTSAMLVGAGVRGGQVIGALDEYAMGMPVDPISGALAGSGAALLPAHLGATLLRLANLDPGDHDIAEPSLDAVIS